MSSPKSSIPIHYCKIKTPKWESLDETTTIQNIQCYNPIYSWFFDMNETNYNHISLNQLYHIHSADSVIDHSTKKIHKRSIHVKYAPLLDPIRFMIGKYESPVNLCVENLWKLPQLNDTEEACHPKLLSPYNASYTDNFFNYLSSQLLNHHQFANGVDYYGSFLGIQDKYKMDITDDVEYLHDSTYFHRNVGKLFTVEMNRIFEKEDSPPESRANRNRLVLGDESILMDDIVDLGDSLEYVSTEESMDSKDVSTEESMDSKDSSTEDLSIEPIEFEEVWNKETTMNISCSSNSSSNSLVNYSSDEEEPTVDEMERMVESNDSQESNDSKEDDDDNTEYTDLTEEDDEDDDDDDEDDDEAVAYIHNFPVQMICLEKCDGTLDALFEQGEMNPKTGASALMQILMTLLTYQKAFHFTHNDLHTNNVMYKNTKAKYVYYVFEGKWYKVPTYGRIFKLIDFGRSIYQFRGHKFCSDSFAVGGDAATQYNTEPFLVEGKPRLEPNDSFDLCRLGCSMYDFIIDGEDEYEMDEFQRTVARWCKDDRGKNILYMKNGSERYPNFKLYKMIARTVHQHTPRAQLDFPLFRQFMVAAEQTIDNKAILVNIDSIPDYTLHH